MTLGYYATSKKAAEGILRGSYTSEHGNLGNGYHFSKNPRYAYDNSTNPEVIILVTIMTGRCMSESSKSSDWDLAKVHDLGFDSLQNENEICVFETSRIKCSGYIKWDQRNVLFNVYDCDFNPDHFKFLTEGKIADFNFSGSINLKGNLVANKLNFGMNEPFRA